ncbi:hydrogenase [Legionella qingyii]|uniref:Hydrogenase n=1 Tax=Legionella qingyii TaxID=2184757 RepID=A0A317U7E3_9GAMM|nr:hydrogenase [Legionella qingyii]RUR26604.1 hydrogenase [Legionella qingyii]RUR27568.1 hydrogenase [Legionella qingyii]
MKLGRKLIRYGVFLFLLGLITGFILPLMHNPRMGLSSHLEGILNGIFLILLGLIWPQLNLSTRVQSCGFVLSLFGTYTNWATTFLAGMWGAGAEMMPIAGGNFYGLGWQEVLIKLGLISLSLAMVLVCCIVLWGLRGATHKKSEKEI